MRPCFPRASLIFGDVMLYRIFLAVSLLTATGEALADSESEIFRKAGLWEISIHKPAETIMRSVTVSQCSAPLFEPDILLSIAPGQEDCVARKVDRARGRIEIRTVCRVHSERVETTMSMTGDFDAGYKGNIVTSFSDLMAFPSRSLGIVGPGMGSAVKKRTEEVSYEARWIGPCTPGMHPGDILLSNGIKVNPLEDRNRVKPGR